MYCCPPPPLSDRQVEHVARILSSARVRTEDLDAWDLTLTCDHVVRSTQHRDYGDRYAATVLNCPTCARRRGIVTAARVGPAGDNSGQVARDRLAAELAAVDAKLDKQRKAVRATERRVADLTRQLEEQGDQSVG
jgi:primosomal protein N''